ncbi:START domain-containing protein 10 [Eurytemora carolleeae]|uniref:START domain-containing protein 10 n=1 Tax=Eurytemora carolleeae TaxID=1294199 RepID=UPI000C76EC6E|nr:START domain-containing protein 10 [Eurytemora carolleeae]|eukprot:XP_023333248.1 START domain-containing protein 10-like [Eurytemora affinis]
MVVTLMLIDSSTIVQLILSLSGSTVVSSRPAAHSSFRMLRMSTEYKNINADTMYDVLHDPEYRKTWDKHMVESKDLGALNPNNDISYYAIRCPPPLRNRDFVLQRSWLQTQQEYFIINHSVFHKQCPRRKDYIRGVSHLTGFLITPMGKGCKLGKNIILSFIMIKRLEKAAENYRSWKQFNRPGFKPWLYPEQLENRISIQDCIRDEGDEVSTPEDESQLMEDDLQLQVQD